MFNLFYGALYLKRWLRNRHAALRLGLGFMAVIMGTVGSLLFLYTFFFATRMPLWYPGGSWLLLSVVAYCRYRVIVLHLDMEDQDEGAQPQREMRPLA